MLTRLTLDSFKNHSSGSFFWQERNIVTGPNGSGKTNLLESIYLLVNGTPAPGMTMTRSVRDGAAVFSIGGGVMKWSLEYECRIGCDTQERSVHFGFQWRDLKRSGYLDVMPDRAVLFSPMEMNILYLGPSLRRDILDEALSLSSPSFAKTRRDYATALRNRNALLKSIRERRSRADELDPWDHLFTEHAVRYYVFRLELVNFVRTHMDSIEELLGRRYRMRFEYASVANDPNLADNVLAHLRKAREHDIASGHTSVWPHLDDFAFHVELGSDRSHRSSEYLSRGENKTILLGFKFIAIRFIEAHGKKNTILLIDDLFSELDHEHTGLVLAEAGDRQIFVTSQNDPGFYSLCRDFHTVKLY